MGDEENDLTMLEWAGFCVAMANAVPKVMGCCQGSNDKTNEEFEWLRPSTNIF